MSTLIPQGCPQVTVYLGKQGLRGWPGDFIHVHSRAAGQKRGVRELGWCAQLAEVAKGQCQAGHAVWELSVPSMYSSAGQVGVLYVKKVA